MRQNYVQQLQALLQDSVSLEQALTSLIASDDYFRVDVQQAYAVSWAMTFYLLNVSQNSCELSTDFYRSGAWENTQSGTAWQIFARHSE